ncbi:MAG: hypothetical protein ABFS23_03435 [Pseudomonadota bacterium]
MRVGIGVQVSSIEGACEDLPRLLELFAQYKVFVTLFISLGPDRSVSWWQRFGGAPFIADAAAECLEPLIDTGHEVGLAPFDPATWARKAAHATASWTQHQVLPGVELFKQLLGRAPECFGVAQFQVNPHLLELETSLDFRFASDVRGKTVFLPRSQGIDGNCPQIPATLPSVEEALQHKGVRPANVHEELFDTSQEWFPTGHVWRISVESEGRDHLDVVEKMLVMWRGSQREIGTLGTLLEPVELDKLRRHQIGWQRVRGDGFQALQSVAVD